MSNVNKIMYAEATLKQLAKAKAVNPIKYASLEGKNYKEILNSIGTFDKNEKYKSYNKNGTLTLVGKAKRLTDLKEIKLPKNATISEYLEKKWLIFCKMMDKKLKEIEKKINPVTCGPKN